MWKYAYLVLIGALASQCARPLSLQFAPADNAHLVYELSINADTQTQVMGMDIDTKTEQDMVYSMDCAPPSPIGDRVVTVVYNTIRMSQTMPQGTTYYNSDDPSTDDGGPIASMMGAMIDQPFTMVISSEGETKSVKGLAEIVDHAIEQMSGLGEEAKEAMKAQFGGEAMTRNLKSITAFFPPNPVKIGESWENEQTVANGGMELIVNSLYTFVGREDGLARIQVEGDILTNPDADAMEIMGMTFEYNLQGTQMGYILVDENTGVAVHSAITQAFMGNMTTDTPETGPMNLSLVVDNTIDIQLQEDQP